MALTFDCVLVEAGREPAGFAVFIRHSPDGLRRFANKVSGIGRRRPMLFPFALFQASGSPTSTADQSMSFLAASTSASTSNALCKSQRLTTTVTSPGASVRKPMVNEPVVVACIPFSAKAESMDAASISLANRVNVVGLFGSLVLGSLIFFTPDENSAIDCSAKSFYIAFIQKNRLGPGPSYAFD